MKYRYGMIAVFVALVTAIITALSPVAALGEYDQPFVSLGADLTAEQREQVLELLGITENDLTEDTVVTVTNEDEHRYLDGIVSSDAIGTKALSSCKVIQQESGYGIKVETYNVTYVSAAMFQNALATAGMKDALVVVAAPVEISGTAALVGAMQAYAKMNGQAVQTNLITSAVRELVTSGQLSEFTGNPEKVTQLIAAVKQVAASGEISDAEDMREAIADISSQLELSLSEDEIDQVMSLMEGISELNLDPEELTEQVKSIYESAKAAGLDLSKYGISDEKVNSIFESLPQLIERIIDMLRSIFGKSGS